MPVPGSSAQIRPVVWVFMIAPAQRLPGGGEQPPGRALAAAAQLSARRRPARPQPRRPGQARPAAAPGSAGPSGTCAAAGLFLWEASLARDWAADRVRPPPGRVIVGPFGDVEVERADRGQHAAAISAWRRRGHQLAVRAGRVTVLVITRCFHAAATSRGSFSELMPGVVRLDVGPEQLAQQVGVVLQGGEIHRWLAFGQVVDEDVADRAAPDVVAVDQLLAGGPSAAARRPASSRARPR